MGARAYIAHTWIADGDPDHADSSTCVVCGIPSAEWDERIIYSSLIDNDCVAIQAENEESW